MLRILGFLTVIAETGWQILQSFCKYGIMFILLYILFILHCFVFAGIDLKQKLTSFLKKHICPEISDYDVLEEMTIHLPKTMCINLLMDSNIAHCQILNKDTRQYPKKEFYNCICPKCGSVNELLFVLRTQACLRKKDLNCKRHDNVSPAPIPDENKHESMESRKYQNFNNKDGCDSPGSICENNEFLPKNGITLSPRCPIILNDNEMLTAETTEVSAEASKNQTKIYSFGTRECMCCESSSEQNILKSSMINFDEFEEIDLNSPSPQLNINLNRARLTFEKSSHFIPEKKSYFAKKWNKWIKSLNLSYTNIIRDEREDISSITDYKASLTSRGNTVQTPEEKDKIYFRMEEMQTPKLYGCCCNAFLKLKSKLNKYRTGVTAAYKRF